MYTILLPDPCIHNLKPTISLTATTQDCHKAELVPSKATLNEKILAIDVVSKSHHTNTVSN